MSGESPVGGRYLIVNADDFGQSAGVNAGVIEAFEHGVVTSASLMVRWPAASSAAEYARMHPDFSVGLHFDVGEFWFREGEWHARYRVVAGDDGDAMRAEAEQQLATFRRLTGTDPTHLDSHQHVHRHEPAASALGDIADRISVPLRDACPRVTYRGDFYGQTTHGEPNHGAITAEAFVEVLQTLRVGYTELGCHPAHADDLETTYSAERLIELRTLCDPVLSTALRQHGVELRSFRDVAASNP